MDAMEVELLGAEVDALVGELDEERYRHVAGLEPTPSLQAIFGRHSRAASRDSVKELEARQEGELAAKVAGLFVERAQAAGEERWRAAEATARGQGPDGPIGLAAAQLSIVRERDRDRRLALGRAVAEACGSGARDAAVEERAGARAGVDLLPDWKVVVAADDLLGRSDDAYRDLLGWMARREAGLAAPPGGGFARADLLYVLALHGWEGLFPPGMLAITLERTAAALRLDLGRVRVDDARRDGQWPGAHAFGARISLRRQGGAADWLGLFDAAGQALAAATVSPRSRHRAATFAIGWLLSGLLVDRGFLMQRLEVERSAVRDLVRGLALRQLFRLRARAAACRVATEVERGTSGAAWRSAYGEAMAMATLSPWPATLAARDGDASSLAAALEGAARAEHLRRSMVERCDEDWWKNPRAAELLGGWLAGGGAWAGEEPKLSLAAEALVSAMA